HGEPGRKVGDLDGAVGGVDALAARSARGGDVETEVLVFELDVDLVRLRQDGDGGGGGVDAALRLGGGNTLNPVIAALVLEDGVDVVAADERDDFLDAA